MSTWGVLFGCWENDKKQGGIGSVLLRGNPSSSGWEFWKYSKENKRWTTWCEPTSNTLLIFKLCPRLLSTLNGVETAKILTGT